MSSRDIERVRLARQVTTWLREPAFREGLIVGADGSRPVVPCLPDDSVEHMFSLVEAAGGTASVVVRLPEGRFGVVGVDRGEHGSRPADEADCPVHPDTHVDMLVTYLRRHSGPTHCRVVAPDYAFALVKEVAGQS